jgi:hypothetical protein
LKGQDFHRSRKNSNCAAVLQGTDLQLAEKVYLLGSFVTGPGFSRAENAENKNSGFSPCHASQRLSGFSASCLSVP